MSFCPCRHLDERWEGNHNARSGKTAAVAAGPHVMTVHRPEGFRLERAEVGGEKVECARRKETAAVWIVPPATKTVEWKTRFVRQARP